MNISITLTDDPNEATRFDSNEKAMELSMALDNLADSDLLKSIGIESSSSRLWAVTEVQDENLAADGIECWSVVVARRDESHDSFGPSRWVRFEASS